jgi:hypothetical protein
LLLVELRGSWVSAPSVAPTPHASQGPLRSIHNTWALRTILLLLPLGLHAIGFLMPLMAMQSFEQHYTIIHKVRELSWMQLQRLLF